MVMIHLEVRRRVLDIAALLGRSAGGGLAAVDTREVARLVEEIRRFR
jgi:hypothetical protein